jgi:hypothetical protein
MHENTILALIRVLKNFKGKPVKVTLEDAL